MMKVAKSILLAIALVLLTAMCITFMFCKNVLCETGKGLISGIKAGVAECREAVAKGMAQNATKAAV